MSAAWACNSLKQPITVNNSVLTVCLPLCLQCKVMSLGHEGGNPSPLTHALVTSLLKISDQHDQGEGVVVDFLQVARIRGGGVDQVRI